MHQSPSHLNRQKTQRRSTTDEDTQDRDVGVRAAE